MAKTIVVYGATMAGVAAAAKAAKNAPSATIHLIVPDPVDYNGNGCCLGAIGTVGGQNFFDIGWKKIDSGEKIFFTKGSFNWWESQMGQHYSVDAMSDLLKSDLTKAEYGGRIKIHYAYDITGIGWEASHITEVRLCHIKRDDEGIVQWDTEGSDSKLTITGDVFIDASESGRLTRLSNFGGTVGRYDWPADKLDSDERGSSGKARQQVASLMFKVTGFDMTDLREDLEVANQHENGVCSATGGKDAYKDKNRKIYQFNEKYGPKGFAIKPFNMAEDGPQPGVEDKNKEWWVNAFLVFNVDGRAYNRDLTGDTKNHFPKDMRSDYKTVDDAWRDARRIINSSEFEEAIRDFPGFRDATVVKENGMPVVGNVLYLRETIHSALSSSARANDTENSNYALRATDFLEAGTADNRNYAKRMGLNAYWIDVNAYKFEDLKPNGSYAWPVTEFVRSDVAIPDLSPTYVPYGAIATNFVLNLLIPGYATGVASLGWAAARTIPNQCVLGDAAGVAAAYAVNNNIDPLNFGSADITAIQNTLKNSGALLEK
ncbi:MAG: FAD-dependent oxidoreductase [Evtepia gabavorous]|uniref:FAD-dependent oxidoreductase n=1 Tax=Evtepia gabavorous TaxID=2211183 RepID=UPI002E78ED96|nr:FAD-dependent oxidoreductase [Evtepia gabavorous]MEE0067442.1 FAD-dependent oxidoreductase [Evtepia gabavorous]